jgi:Arc/MetJ family transcription regulator
MRDHGVVPPPSGEERGVSPTWIDIDDEALRETMRFSGARNQDDAVNLALRVYAARHRSRAEAPGERDRSEATPRSGQGTRESMGSTDRAEFHQGAIRRRRENGA